MQRYTITEALSHLGIHRQQFWEVCALLRIVPQDSENLRKLSKDVEGLDRRLKLDKRLKTISAEELQQLADYLTVVVPDGELARLTAVVAQLATRIVALEEAQRQLPSVREVERLPMPSARPQALVRVVAEGPRGLPDGAIATRDFATRHHVPEWTAKEHVRLAKIAETVQDMLNRPGQQRHYLTRAQQAHAVAFWRSAYEKFAPCEECFHEDLAF